MARTATAKKLKPKDFDGEFVVGGRASYTGNVYSLDSRDRVEPRLTKEIADKLRLDSEFDSSLEFLCDAVFSNPIQAIPAVCDDTDAEFAEAKKIADFMQDAIDDTARPFSKICKEMFRATYLEAVKSAEIVLKVSERLDKKLILDRVNPKPNYATGFVCDKFFNVLGLVGAKDTNRRPPSRVALNSEEIIAREKFLIFSFELEDNDPRAIAKARSAIADWCEKQDTREMWKEFRRTSAIPKKVGETPPNAKRIKIYNDDNTPKIVDGVQKTESAEKQLMTALKGLANNSTITVPNGTKVTQLEATAKGEVFEKAWKTHNSGIRKSVLGDALTTGEADKDARAAREAAFKNVVALRISSFMTDIEAQIECDIFRLLTVLNYGADKVHLTPHCSLGGTAEIEWTPEAASAVGFMANDEQQNEIGSKLGLTAGSGDRETEKQEKEENE